MLIVIEAMKEHQLHQFKVRILRMNSIGLTILKNKCFQGDVIISSN